MQPRKFALFAGYILLAMGILAFMPGFFQFVAGDLGVTADLPPLRVESSYGTFLGFLPMNVLNKIALIVLGFLGISAARNDERASTADRQGTGDLNEVSGSEYDSIRYSRTLLFVLGALAILGLIPQTNTLFGIMPLFEGNVWFYGIFAALGAYYGYSLHSRRYMDHHHHTPHLRGV